MLMLTLVVSVAGHAQKAVGEQTEINGLYYNLDYFDFKKNSRIFGEAEVTDGEKKYSGDVVIPATVTYGKDYKVARISMDAFSRCPELNSVTIPNSVTSIGYGAFSACWNLTSVTVPNSITNIEESAFQDCDSLITVVNLSKTPQNITDATFSVYGTLHVLPGCKAAYEVADVWKNFTIVEDADLPAEVIAVYDLIDAIGKVENTEESKAKIAAARSAYDALTKEQQALVKNLSILIEAENAYKQFETTGIANVEAKAENKAGKYLENGKVVIVKDSKKYNLNGLAE